MFINTADTLFFGEESLGINFHKQQSQKGYFVCFIFLVPAASEQPYQMSKSFTPNEIVDYDVTKCLNKLNSQSQRYDARNLKITWPVLFDLLVKGHYGQIYLSAEPSAWGSELDSTLRALGDAALESSDPQEPAAGAELTGAALALALAEGRMGWKS